MEPPYVVDGIPVNIYANVGIVHFPEHGEDVDILVQRAGVALHYAHNSDKGYSVYDPSKNKHSPMRLSLISELKSAIERDELMLYYQPKIDVIKGEVCGVEALLRWIHPVYGFIPPDEFVLLAERNRLIKPLTLWVLKRAFQDCAKWCQDGLPLTVSINLSTKDLHDPELPDLISGAAVSANIRPEWILFEITESSVMAEPENALAVVKRLHGMGYRFSIDDFGTGYSSLAYLKKLPLSEIKIDKGFVMDILSSENDAAIVKATINLGHNLGLTVTAEGVENSQILSNLKELGCDIAQGYFFSKPIAFDDLTKWIVQSRWQIAPGHAS